MLAHPVYAALINVGDDPLVGLIILIILVGIAVFVALWVLNTFLAPYVVEPFLSAARFLIWAIGIIIVVRRLLAVIFGISLF